MICDKDNIIVERLEHKLKHADREGFYGTPLRYRINQNIRGWIIKYCPLNNSEILDVGCGEGNVRDILSESGVKGNYLGIDIKQSPNWGAMNNGRLKVSFLLQDSHTLGSLKRSFNFCISITAFEHFLDDGKVMAEIKKVLLPGAILLLVVPSKYSYLLYRSHGLRRYSKKDVEDLAKDHSFRVVELKKLGGAFGFLMHLAWSFVSWLLCSAGKCIYHIGLIRNQKFYYAVNNIMHLHLTRPSGRVIHKALQRIAYKIDQKLPFFESGYCAALKNE